MTTVKALERVLCGLPLVRCLVLLSLGWLFSSCDGASEVHRARSELRVPLVVRASVDAPASSDIESPAYAVYVYLVSSNVQSFEHFLVHPCAHQALSQGTETIQT